MFMGVNPASGDCAAVDNGQVNTRGEQAVGVIVMGAIRLYKPMSSYALGSAHARGTQRTGSMCGPAGDKIWVRYYRCV